LRASVQQLPSPGSDRGGAARLFTSSVPALLNAAVATSSAVAGSADRYPISAYLCVGVVAAHRSPGLPGDPQDDERDREADDGSAIGAPSATTIAEAITARLT
jgi:hypothetical protein